MTEAKPQRHENQQILAKQTSSPGLNRQHIVRQGHHMRARLAGAALHPRGESIAGNAVLFSFV
jgi:hypothetical protein